MATAKPSIEYILNQNESEQLNFLKYKWSNDIQDSNVMINDVEYNDNYIRENKDKVSAMIDRLNKTIDFYTELGIDIETVSSEHHFQEIRRNLDSNYRKLSLFYYNYNFELFSNEVENTGKRIAEITKEKNELKESMQNTNAKIENLGATFLNMVLTISIVSTMITLLTKVTFEYALIVIFGCAWLLLTCMIFIVSFFKDEEKQKFRLTFPNIIYLALTIITIVLFLIVSVTNR